MAVKTFLSATRYQGRMETLTPEGCSAVQLLDVIPQANSRGPSGVSNMYIWQQHNPND